MNVIVWLEFELACYDFADHRFNHYTTRTPPVIIWLNAYACVCVGIHILCMDIGWEKLGEVNEYLEWRWSDWKKIEKKNKKKTQLVTWKIVSWVLWHINHWTLSNAKSCLYIYIKYMILLITFFNKPELIYFAHKWSQIFYLIRIILFTINHLFAQS